MPAQDGENRRGKRRQNGQAAYPRNNTPNYPDEKHRAILAAGLKLASFRRHSSGLRKTTKAA
jgi:hypothetical protein